MLIAVLALSACTDFFVRKSGSGPATAGVRIELPDFAGRRDGPATP
jgi:hypothetical protein